MATTVNAMFDAWNRGDGELACAYMTSRGQRLAVRIARQLHQVDQPVDSVDCVAAIADSAAATNETIGQSVHASAVSLPTPRRASVASEFRGAMSLKRVGERWRVVIPTFID